MSKAADNLEELVSTLRRWQKIEGATVAQTARILEKTQNPLIRMVMEIIRQDSVMHEKVQQVILDGLEKEAFSLTPEELGEVWELVEQHLAMERETVELGEKARRNCRLLLHRHLLDYLIHDERKHERLLEQLEDIKRRINPYA
jgi:hypothetical protein